MSDATPSKATEQWSLQVQDVMLSRKSGNVQGLLTVTRHHVVFSWADKECKLMCSEVEGVEKKGGDTPLLVVRCKNFRTIYFGIPNETDRSSVHLAIQKHSYPDVVTKLLPFYYRRTFELEENGWSLYNAEVELMRLGVPNTRWRLSTCNADYAACASYPRELVVPASVPDSTLTASAQFRAHGRFPILSYLHPSTNAAIVRCAQPLRGPNQARRNGEDEELLKAVFATNPNKGINYIVDTRTNNYALAKTGGVESEEHYPNCKRIFLGIDGRHTFRDGFNRILDACHDHSINATAWLSRLDSAGWLKHIQMLLWSSSFVAQIVALEASTVVLHGEEGWDSTSAVTSLAQLILDPYFRTLRGFQMLVEREWLRAGHRFDDRCAHCGTGQTRYRNSSPVFLLFLDCVWQLQQQFPAAFEFNEGFLGTLFEHAYSSEFGTFLGNSERDRQAAAVAEKTTSLWSFTNRAARATLYRNPLYELRPHMLEPSYAPQHVRFWSTLYSRWDFDWGPALRFFATVARLDSQRAAAAQEVAEGKLALREAEERLGAEVAEVDSKVAALEARAAAPPANGSSDPLGAAV